MKSDLQAVPLIAQFLDDGDLLLNELDELWKAAPKFPEIETSSQKEERIDVDSFMQIYRDIDDLFEDEDDADNAQVEKISPNADANRITSDEDNTTSENEEDPVTSKDEKELELAFKNICDSAGLVSKNDLKNWDEIEQLISDEMLGEDEFDVLWTRTGKSPGSPDQLDVEGFLSFNVALDDLFEFDDEEIEDNISPAQSASSALPMVSGDDLPPGVIFSQLANKDFLVGKDDLKRWVELATILEDGELLPSELEQIFEKSPKAPGSTDMLNEDGFIVLYNLIDELFVDEDEEETTTKSRKNDLLDVLARLNQDDELPCGLESSENEQTRVLEIVSSLETESVNRVLTSGGKIIMSDLSGSWDLLYTSSGMMRFNKGLSGLGGSFPNGKFAGLRQNLIATKYITDVEYVERIEVNPEANSFDVVVSGDWELKSSVSLLTGAPTTIMAIEPDKVVYGPTTTRADHWKSVRSMNLLDLSYLDDDFRIMRGNTSTDTLFIFKRSS